MEAQSLFYYFGIAFFALWFVFLAVLIGAGYFLIKSIKEVREKAVKTMEDKSLLASLLPMVLVGGWKVRELWKKFRS